MRRCFARLRREEGVAALEFAIVSQLLFLLLYGILMYGFIFGLNHTITQSAAEGARATLSQPDTSTDAQLQTYAQNYARNNLSSSLARQYATITATVLRAPSGCPYDTSISCIQVTISYDNRSHPIIPAFLGMQYLTPATISSTAVVELD